MQSISISYLSIRIDKKRETVSFVIQSPAKVAVSAVVQQFGSNKLTTDLQRAISNFEP